MKKSLIICCAFLLALATGCTAAEKIDFSKGFYKFKILTSYDECIETLKNNNLNYVSNEIHDKVHGTGVIVSVDNVMRIHNKDVSLKLSFPDTLYMVDDYVDFKSEVLLNFTYEVRGIDLEYAKSFIQYCNSYFGEPKHNEL